MTEAVRNGRNGRNGEALDEDGIAHLLGYHLARASVPARRAFSERIGTPLGLRPVEFSLLQLLARNADVTQKQLAEVLRLAAPAVTVLLDRLSERGLLRRERSETDRRAQHVRLTADGAELAERAYRASLDMEAEAFAGLSASERRRLIALLERAARAGDADRLR